MEKNHFTFFLIFIFLEMFMKKFTKQIPDHYYRIGYRYIILWFLGKICNGHRQKVDICFLECALHVFCLN